VEVVVNVVVVIALMVSRKKVTISWSGGKDSAFALYKILLSGEYDVVSLHTTIGRETKRVGLHGVHEQMIERQASRIGIPLIKLYLEGSESGEAYEQLMHNFYAQCAKSKIDAVVFGDIFLEDLRVYRERLLSPSNLHSIFPIWNIPTEKLILDFIHTGFKTLVCSADARFFSKSSVGRTVDETFVRDMPEEVDVCGERGEFHTFVYDGPIFTEPVPFAFGDVVLKWYEYNKIHDDKTMEKLRSSFWFQDLLPRIAS
jgi:uncharacterized protein (TIGR00290 family)